MLERIEALESAVRQLLIQIQPLLPKPEPAAVPTKDPAEAQRDLEAAEAEVKNQQDRAAANVKAAQDAAARAKAIRDKSQAEAKAQEPEPPKEQPPARRGGDN